jgi:hypothetical protein
MKTPVEETPVLEEFQQFLKFLQSLWAMLAGVSVLFPLSNALTRVIPLAQWSEGGFAYFSPALVSIISTVACLFIILWTFGHRHQSGRKRPRMQKHAVLSFTSGGIAIILYLVVYHAIANDFYFNVLGWESGDFRRVAGDVLLLVAYSAFFVLMTRAFMLLGMVEYFGRKRHTT